MTTDVTTVMSNGCLNKIMKYYGGNKYLHLQIAASYRPQMVLRSSSYFKIEFFATDITSTVKIIWKQFWTKINSTAKAHENYLFLLLEKFNFRYSRISTRTSQVLLKTPSTRTTPARGPRGLVLLRITPRIPKSRWKLDHPHLTAGVISNLKRTVKNEINNMLFLGPGG